MLEAVVQDILDDFPARFTEARVTRWAERALPGVAVDLSIAYAIDGETVSPDMPAAHREIWLLASKLLAVQALISQSAANHSWKAGDASGDRRDEAKRWLDLFTSLKADYSERVGAENPDYRSRAITPGGGAGTFRRGSCLEDLDETLDPLGECRR